MQKVAFGSLSPPTTVFSYNTLQRMLLALLIAFVFKRYYTEASPVPVLGAHPSRALSVLRDESTSDDGCHLRTIWNILRGCLATTMACTWVSIHPNVPFKNEGRWEVLARRLFLMFFSILAPEVMVMWAFKQWRGAILIREEMNEANPGRCTYSVLSTVLY